ncbi:MAG: S8 family serine peptidase [Candidatus Sumerlaeaceae bacterium]|nr:S8 family serine peptidase [Candidatus Sumerlaeaceae bacterium]
MISQAKCTVICSAALVATLLAQGAPLAKQLGVAPSSIERKIAPQLLAPKTEKRVPVHGGEIIFRSTPEISRQGKRTIVVVGCTSVDKAVLDKFKLQDSTILGVYPDFQCIRVAVGSEADLRAMAAIPEVVRIRPAYKGHPNTGIASSQAVQAQRVDLVQNGRFLDGASQKVGILSDSFAYGPLVRTPETVPAQNMPGTLKHSIPQATGDLPPEVELLADDAATYYPGWEPSDEGEAMAELVHDIAPGAQIAFHTAEPDFLRMADGILALRSAGCTVITDDYTYVDEPWIMESPVSTAIDSVVRSGVAYFTCSGNSADTAAKRTYVDVNPSATDEAFPASGVDFADWGGGYGAYLPVTMYPHSTLILVLQWNQPWETFAPSTGGAQIDLDLYIMTEPVPPGEATLSFALADEQGVPGTPYGDPIEAGWISYSGSDPVTLYLAVDHFAGPQRNIPQNRRTPVEFWLWAYRALENGVDFPLSGPVTTGHQTAPGAACVGAVPFDEAPGFDPVNNGPTPYIDPEWFSAKGGSITIPFDARGRFRKRTIIVPNLAAVDGCDTLSFGYPYDDGTAFPNFFGTSAAAPNAAAVAALLRQADPKMKPKDLLTILMRTAVDVTGERAAAGFDDVTGAGLVDAYAAIGRVKKGENLAIVPYIPVIALTASASSEKTSTCVPKPYDRLLLDHSPAYAPPQGQILAGLPMYAWFAVANTGNSASGKASLVEIAVDGIVVKSLPVPPLYGPSYYGFDAVELPPLSEGSHGIEVRVDATRRIRELNEGDNVYRETVEVLASP